MAGFKETPRQKMIGMMYLVLTALLALNVSKEILDAFVIVNESVVQTSENFSEKVGDLHNEFEMQYSINKDKVGPHYIKSAKAKKISNDLINYIDSVKFVVISKTEGIPFDTAKIRTLAELHAKDNYEKPSTLLVGSGETTTSALGYDLQKKIDNYRVEMLNIIPEKDRAGMKIGLKTDGVYHDASGAEQNWVRHNFYHTILAADVTIFNKLVNEVRNSEYDVVSYLFQGITKQDFKFNSITAKILPKSVFVFQGDPFEAEVIVAAVDDQSQPVVDYVMGIEEWNDNLINSAINIKGDSGIVKLIIPTDGKEPRSYTLAGRIGIKKPNNGGMEYHPFSSKFFVAEPSANVSATKMNVFYRGVDNPIKISAAGVPKSELQYSIRGDGKIVKTKDGLVVQGLSKGNVNSVTVHISSGEGADRKELGKQEFRVKDLPGPDIMVRDMSNGAVNRGVLLANPYLLCQLPDYVNFQYDYKVTSFTLSYMKGGDTFNKHSTSPYLTAEMKAYIKKARKNTMLVFTNIEVQGPIRKMRVSNFAVKIN